MKHGQQPPPAPSDEAWYDINGHNLKRLSDNAPTPLLRMGLESPRLHLGERLPLGNRWSLKRVRSQHRARGE